MIDSKVDQSFMTKDGFFIGDAEELAALKP